MRTTRIMALTALIVGGAERLRWLVDAAAARNLRRR
jgi:hypothetical protein